MAFHEELAPFAVLYGNRGRVLPALIVAQAILESANGTSELAVKAHNLFGIKKGADWTGKTYTKISPEFSAVEGWIYPSSEFRAYDSFEECVADLVAFYQKPRYEKVVGESDFATAATAAWTAGYATDPAYPLKLIAVYENYGLKKMEVGNMAVAVISVAAGHAGFGVTPGKRGPDGKYEWNWNNKVLLAFASYMAKNFQDVKVVRVDDPTGRTDVPLSVRAARANAAGAICHIDFHHNALSTAWFDGPGGVETFVMTPMSANPSSHELAKQIHPRVVKAMGLRDRGIKQANFAMLRLTKMPAVLVEGGFMDSRVDRKEMDNPNRTTAQGEGAAEGVGAWARFKRASPVVEVSSPARNYVMLGDSGPKVVDIQQDLSELGYKIAIDGEFGANTKAVVIAFQKDNKLTPDGVFGAGSRSAADKLLDQLKVLPKEWFRVRESWGNVASQLGAFGDLEGAKEVADLNKGYEVYDDDGKVVYPIPKPAPAPTQKWYRIRDDWDDVKGQLAAFPEPSGAAQAKAFANQHADKGYKVFDNSGKVFFDPIAARQAAERIQVQQLISENKAPQKFVGLIVYNGPADISAVYDLHMKTGYAAMMKSNATSHSAKHIIVVGGRSDGFEKKASERFTHLSGGSSAETDALVAAYIKSL